MKILGIIICLIFVLNIFLEFIPGASFLGDRNTNILGLIFGASLINIRKTIELINNNYKTFLIAVCIALAIRSFLFEPFSIPSGSMKPNLLEGDYLFVSKYSYGFSRHSFPFAFPPFSGRIFGKLPKRGDVAVFAYTKDTSIDYIKRIVGLPGDRVQVKQGILYVNDEEVPRISKGEWRSWSINNNTYYTYNVFMETFPSGVSYDVLDIAPNQMLDNTDIYHVPKGHIFAMGDNRDQSSDSRILTSLGFIPIENLVGRAEVIFYSHDRLKPRLERIGKGI